MSSPLIKSTSVSPAEPAPVGADDHRKRRRNRTTQSCLNCHSSKRMCDRKRPCGRCTKLGLTGLCVYQVDDTTPGSNDVQDETTRLQKRIAELESVVRELKNRPHPRWLRTNLNQPVMLDRRGSSPVMDRDDGGSPWHPPTSDENSIFTPCSIPSASNSSPTSPSPRELSSTLDPANCLSDYDSAPSRTDIEQLLRDEDALNQLISQFFESGSSPMLDSMIGATQHCGCLQDLVCYSMVLELSLRLRRAAECLEQHINHQSGTPCSFNQRIKDLDKFTSYVLGNSTPPIDFISAPSGNCRPNPTCPLPARPHGFGVAAYPTPPHESDALARVERQIGAQWGINCR